MKEGGPWQPDLLRFYCAAVLIDYAFKSAGLIVDFIYEKLRSAGIFDPSRRAHPGTLFAREPLSATAGMDLKR